MFYKSIIKNLVLFSSSFLITGLINQKIYCKQKKYQTFIWGNGYYQARPDALLQFHNFCPHHIKNLPSNLIDLKFGQYYEAGIDTEGNLYIWDKQALDSNFDQTKKTEDQQRKNIVKLYKNVKSVRFTQGFIWILTKNKQIIQFPIIKQFNQTNEITSTKLGNSRQVEPLRGSIQLQTGNDHIITLKQNGSVYAMGDDTYGQCGQADKTRHTQPPFDQFRIKYPVQVKYLKNIQKICAGGNHNLAVDKGGNLFGWGSNSLMQLSHEQQYSQMNSPLICSFTPIKISKGLDGSDIEQMAVGQQFSVLTTTNRSTQSNQVFTFGGNLKGQLGVGQVRHLKDISRVEALSNYILKVKGKQEKVKIQQLSCGNNHCIALLNIGYIMQWGDNQYGQLGNRKRSCSMSPIVLRDFVGKKIVGVFAGQNSTGVIIEQQEQK